MNLENRKTVLENIWREVLGLDITDDSLAEDAPTFFEWGGTSLMALQLAVVYEDRTGDEFPIDTMMASGRLYDVMQALATSDQGSSK